MTMKQSLLGISVVALAIFAIGPTSIVAQNQNKPNFSGIWGGGIAQLTPTTCKQNVDAFPQGQVERFGAGGAKGGLKWITFEQDCSIQNRGRVNKPLYKPQYWEQVRLHDYYANAGGQWKDYADPEWLGLPRGVPRLGPPNKIVQTADEVIFLYENQNQFRVVPTDCREHDPVLKYDQSFNGLAVGCWEGDTLVVTSMGFTDRTWLHWSGYIHSNEMTVIERLRREGDTLIYQATVEDPVMFLEPWKMDPIRLNLNKTPGAQLMQDLPYNDKSLGNLVDPNYRG
jgi:hypothetical protein